MSFNSSDQAEWRVAWCRFCSAGMRLDTQVCPNCKLATATSSEPTTFIVMRSFVRGTLEALLPDLPDLARSIPASEFQELIENIATTSAEMIDNKIAQDLVSTMQDLQLVGYSQPAEVARILVFELFLELRKSKPDNIELLDRPALKALGIDASCIDKELRRRAMQAELPTQQYAPLPPLEIENEKELLRKVLIYLATLEALSGSDWQIYFENSLRAGEISTEEISAELTRWHHLLEKDLQPVRPDSPWRETLKKVGIQHINQADERSFVCSASRAETLNHYAIAQDIAGASLRLLQAASDIGSTSGINGLREKLKVTAQGIVASCLNNKDVESEQSLAQSAFYDSVKQMIIDTFVPKELHGSDLMEALKGMNSALDVAVADSLAKQPNRRQEASLKYNRAIFAAKETIDQVQKKGYKASEKDTARAKVEQLLIIKSLTKLAEIKFLEDELGFSEQYLLSAAKHLEEYDRYRREEPLVSMHAPLRPVIYGSLGLIYLKEQKLGRACRAFKRAKQALTSTMPIHMLGFMITYQGVIDEYEGLKSRLAS